MAFPRSDVRNGSVSLANSTSPAEDRSAGTATRTSTVSAVSAASPAARSGNVTITMSWSAVAATASIVDCRFAGAGSTIPIGRRLVVAEQDGRHDERAHDEQRREGDRQDEAATPGPLEDLAPRDEPDAAEPAHAAAPSEPCAARPG